VKKEKSIAEQQRKAEVRAFSLAELQKAEDDLRIAMLQTQGVIDEYSFMSMSPPHHNQWFQSYPETGYIGWPSGASDWDGLDLQWSCSQNRARLLEA
jgi:hypothetical protein